jgi:hypothetical protein
MTGDVREIVEKIEELRLAESRLDEAKDLVKAWEIEVETLASGIIPEMMRNLGVSSLKLTDGTEFAIKPVLSVKSIADKRGEIIEWLERNEGRNLVKTRVSVAFAREHREDAERFLAEKCAGMEAGAEAWVEPMTLRKFVGDRLEAGKSVPSDLFDVYFRDRVTAVDGKTRKTKEVFER